MVKKILEMTKLYDTYGELLTERQRAIFNLYLAEDLGLAEIAENLAITRQAVYDHINKANRLLSDYEKKLGWVSRSEKRNVLLKRAILQLENAKKDFEIDNIIEILREMASL